MLSGKGVRRAFRSVDVGNKGRKARPPAFCGDTIDEDQSDFSEILARGTGIGAVRSRGSITPLVCFLPKS